jgi:hypothetical protein
MTIVTLHPNKKQTCEWDKKTNLDRYCYAAANRDEFLAETHTIAQGLHVKSDDYRKCKV